MIDKPYLCIGGPCSGVRLTGSGSTLCVPEMNSMATFSPHRPPELSHLRTFRYRLTLLGIGSEHRRYWLPADCPPEAEPRYLIDSMENALEMARKATL